MKNKYITIMAMAVLALVSACKKEYDTNPSAASASQVFSTTQGMTGVVVGLQGLYSTNQTSSIYNKTAITGLTDNELILLNAGNVAELQFVTGGGAVDGTNTDLAGLWATSNKIIYDADLVITNAANLPDKSYASGLIAYATIFKVMAMGDMSMYWQQVPAGIAANVKDNVTFIDRLKGYANAITAINSALSAIQANPVSSAFLANVPAGIDIVNTLHALKARYSLFSGDYTTALTEANAVDLTKTSTFTFSSINQNGVYSSATATNNIFQPVDSTMGLPAPIQPALADKRVPFYIAINAAIAPRFRINGFSATATTPYPLYLPSEMTLIKAEAYARQATPDLANALVQLNIIVTKTPASDPLGVGASLPALTGTYTQAQLLDLIYQNRCIELFMSGLKVEDMRRFNRPMSEMKRNFFPYPFTERYNNPNTPADPTF
jgi:hypothetical protein